MSQFTHNFSFNQEGAILFKSLEGHTYPVLMARFSPDDTFLVSTDGKDMRIWRWDEHQHIILHRVVETATRKITISYDSRFIASIEKSPVFPNIIHIWSSDGKWITDISHNGEECNVLFSPVTSYLIVADTSGHLQWWDMETFSLLYETELPPNSVQSPLNSTVRYLAFAPDGKRLAVQWYTKQGAVQIWELEIPDEMHSSPRLTWSGSVAESLFPVTSLVAGLAYSPDWQYLAVASDIENCVWLFDAFSLDLRGSFKLSPSADGIAAIAFSPNGAYLAIAECNGTLWVGEIASQQLIGMIDAHPSQIGTLATLIGSIDWSTNGKWIVTTGTGVTQTPDYTIKVWKVKIKMS